MPVPAVSVPLRARLALTLGVSLAVAGMAGAHTVRTPDVPAPQDTPYPGSIALQVDAGDVRQGIYRVRETIPVTAGRLGGGHVPPPRL